MSANLIWSSAGSPAPCDTIGVPIEPSRRIGHCAKCGTSNGIYHQKQVVSENFLPTRNSNRLRAFGGDLFCAACVFCAKTLRLRCVSWFASENAGVEFWTLRHSDGLSTLLTPPKPPFVVGIPLYGISHGGESHYQRTWWPSGFDNSDPLVRLQSKHVAIYARMSMSCDRYPVQVDDQGEFILERDLWLRLRDYSNHAMHMMILDGVSAYPSKLALGQLTLPSRASTTLARQWGALTNPLRPYISTNWWPTFLELLPTLTLSSKSASVETNAIQTTP